MLPLLFSLPMLLHPVVTDWGDPFDWPVTIARDRCLGITLRLEQPRVWTSESDLVRIWYSYMNQLSVPLRCTPDDPDGEAGEPATLCFLPVGQYSVFIAHDEGPDLNENHP